LEGEDSLCIEKGETLGLGVDTLHKKRLQHAKGVEGAQVVNPNAIQLERSPRQGNGHTCHEY